QSRVYYQKAEVMLSDLVPEGGQQLDLLGYTSPFNRSGRLMETVDNITRKYLRSAIHLASEGMYRSWSMRAASRVRTTWETGRNYQW
ncbi:MAG: DUF4113 domain-containing protein, partial [Nitrosospira sp.]